MLLARVRAHARDEDPGGEGDQKTKDRREGKGDPDLDALVGRIIHAAEITDLVDGKWRRKIADEIAEALAIGVPADDLVDVLADEVTGDVETTVGAVLRSRIRILVDYERRRAPQPPEPQGTDPWAVEGDVVRATGDGSDGPEMDERASPGPTPVPRTRTAYDPYSRDPSPAAASRRGHGDRREPSPLDVEVSRVGLRINPVGHAMAVLGGKASVDGDEPARREPAPVADVIPLPSRRICPVHFEPTISGPCAKCATGAPAVWKPARPKCGRCDVNMMIDLPGGRVMRCPECHPNANPTGDAVSGTDDGEDMAEAPIHAGMPDEGTAAMARDAVTGAQA